MNNLNHSEIDPKTLEGVAIMGARTSLDIDKSDFIRVWVQARKMQGLPHDSDDWREAFDSYH